MAGDKPPWRIALLRAVNLGPHNKAPAAKLRELMAEEGLANGQTLLASGNLAFRDGRTPAELEDLLESALQSRLGLRTDVMVRTGEAWAGLVAANPFAEFARADPSHLVLIALKAALKPGAVEALRAVIKGPEQALGGDGVVYMTYPDGIGTSRLTGAAVDKALGVKGTGRNWNTVLKLAALTAAA